MLVFEWFLGNLSRIPPIGGRSDLRRARDVESKPH